MLINEKSETGLCCACGKEPDDKGSYLMLIEGQRGIELAIMCASHSKPEDQVWDTEALLKLLKRLKRNAAKEFSKPQDATPEDTTAGITP